MKNDESITDLALPKKLTSFQKLTGLCDCHKLIVSNHAITFKCHARYGTLNRATKIYLFTFFFVTTPKRKVSPVKGILQLVFYPSLREQPIKKYAAGKQNAPTSLIFTTTKPDTPNVFARITAKVLLLCIAKVKFVLTITGLSMLNTESEDLSLFSATFFPFKLSFCFATEIT